MDDAFELLIYVLFILISIIGGVYKNYSKKKAEEQRRKKNSSGNVVLSDPFPEVHDPSPSQQPKRNPFEEFIRQQLEEEIEDEELQVPEAKKNTGFPQEPVPLDNAEVEEGSAAFKSTDDALISDDFAKNPEKTFERIAFQNQSYFGSIEEGDLTKEPGILDDFDLKKAIIYSEILRRPTY